MEYGFEIEFFVTKKKEFVISPARMPMDECGWLVEARGQPRAAPLEAAFSCLADIHRLKVAAKTHKVILSKASYTELDPVLMRTARRTYGKREYPEGRGNIYGIDFAPDDDLARAGLHIHFSDYVERRNEKGEVFRDHRQINMPRIIRALDEKYKKEIEDSKRLPGFYEMKNWGFEYRSLPNTMNLIEVAEFIETIA
jgi:hypothetical protein